MSMPERRGTQALEAWARRATSGYQGVTITNMSTAWRDGLAFCALIHHFRPDLIDFSSLKSENILENNSLAFRVAEQQLGIPALLDAEDMVANPVPDRLSILTYVSQYYRAFSALGLLAERKQRDKDGKTAGEGGDGGGEGKTTPVSRPQSLPATPKTNTETKTDKVLGRGGRGRREVCVTCQNPVFLAERLLVGAPGQLMHRTCFRCARCSTQLTLAGYYQTERGQYCCETCPDEERRPQIGLLAAPSDSESSSEESESDEGEGESEAPRLPDTPAPTPSPTPPRPRTVFLSQTLVTAPDQPTDIPQSTTDNQPTNFTKVSPALFGDTEKAGRVREHSPDPAPLPRTLKSLKTDPPEVLDTGQTKPHIPPDAHTPSPHTATHPNTTPTNTASSIVARRLQLFRNMSNKDKQQQQQQVVVRQQHTSPEARQHSKSFLHGVTHHTQHQLTDQLTDPLRGSKVQHKEDKTTDIPSITVTQDTTDGDGQDSATTTTTTTTTTTSPHLPSSQPIPTTEQNPFEEEDEEEDIAHSHPDSQGKESNAGDKDRDTDLVVSEAMSHREEYEAEKYHSEAEKSYREESEPEKSCREESESEKSHREKNETEKSFREESESEKTHKEKTESEKSHREESESETEQKQQDKVVDETQSDGVVSSRRMRSHTEVTDKVVSPEVESESLGGTEECLVVTLKEPQDDPTTSQPQYPDDLNPFGSEDEEDTKPTPVGGHLQDTKRSISPAPPAAASSAAEPPPQDSPSRRLIKANLNPFESDEEEEEGPEKDISTPKKEEKKSLNPFWSDEEEEEEEMRGRKDSTHKGTKVKPPRPPPPTLPRNRSPSTLSTISTASTASTATFTSPRKKKVIAPPPPSSPQLSLTSSPGGSVALRKKVRRAPAPPQQTLQSGRFSPSDQDTRSLDTVSSGEREDPDEVLSWKIQKDLKNHSNKINGTSQAPPKPSRSPHTPYTASEPGSGRRCSLSKSEAGEWKRKKGPAPLRPVPQKRALKKLPMKVIQQELQDIEIKQTELERQGVLLETSIRKRTESSAPSSPQDETAPSSLPPCSPNSIEVEDMIMQLFELVNEKNELFRRQTELMYLKREKRLEEEHVELEFQIRCLMLKTPAERTDEDTAQEEELIGRLVKVVEQRDEIINCLELDRLREAQEDESIATHMMQYQEKHIDGMDNGNSQPEEQPVKKKKTLKLPKKKKKKKEKDKGASGDADKDVDETETPVDPKKKKKKKKWLF